MQWLFPIAVTVHNCEEAIWMPGWAVRHSIHLPANPGPAQVRVALLVLTIAAFAVTYMSARKGPRSIWAYLTFGYIITMLLNVFVPHVSAALWFRSYSPGVGTAAAINLPLMTYLAWLATREKWVLGSKAVAFGIAVPVCLIVAVAFYMTRAF